MTNDQRTLPTENTLVPQQLMDRPFEPVPHSYSEQDSIRYALSLGLGANPLDSGELRYVYERVTGGLQALPTQANVLGYSGFWANQPGTGITWQKLVHAEQAIVLYRPLPAAGTVLGQTRVVGLHDKGSDKGALLLQERSIVDMTSGELLATVTQTSFLRADGGFGIAYGPSHGKPLAAPHALPDRLPDVCCDLPTLPQAALLYRLNGDLNPLHADPVVAQAAGFAQPILHGLATMGVAMHAVLKALLDYDATAVCGMRVRFTAPVLPGDTLRTELWRDGAVVSLRTTALERGAVVLNAGRVDLA